MEENGRETCRQWKQSIHHSYSFWASYTLYVNTLTPWGGIPLMRRWKKQKQSSSSMESNLLCGVLQNQGCKWEAWANITHSRSKKKKEKKEKKTFSINPLENNSPRHFWWVEALMCAEIKHTAQSHCCLIQHNGESRALSMTARDLPRW